jgi:hypothetical protein
MFAEGRYTVANHSSWTISCHGTLWCGRCFCNTILTTPRQCRRSILTRREASKEMPNDNCGQAASMAIAVKRWIDLDQLET